MGVELNLSFSGYTTTWTVFGNRIASWGGFVSRGDEGTGNWRKLHILERCYLYSSPNVNRIIKLRIMRWAVHVARMMG
jgi:hypothetical protein